jgi:hypothetical protein
MAVDPLNGCYYLVLHLCEKNNTLENFFPLHQIVFVSSFAEISYNYQFAYQLQSE